MGNGGLKAQMGVGDPAQAGSDEQSRQFKASFQSELKAIGGHLTYTATNAEAARHDPLAERRDALYPSFQAALGRIDRTNPAKAKSTIDKVLAEGKALKADVSKFRQEAEKARNDWAAREPKLETAVQQIEGLEEWEDAKAPALRGLVDGVRAHENQRKFAQACTVFDQLEPKLKPIHEEYLRQREAKARYEPAWEALQPRLQEAQQCEFASMVALLEELGAIATQVTAAADARDYVKAEPMLADLTTKVEQCLTLRDELAAKKAAYDEAYAALQPRIPATSEPGGERIVALQDEISTGVDEMTAAAAADDYDTATRLAGDIDAKIVELETAVAGRRRYDEQMAALQPRLPQDPTGWSALADLEAQISSLREQAETAAAADDYEPACTHLTTLETTLAAYETAGAELVEQQQAYEQARAAMEPHLPATSEPGEGRMAEVQAQIEQSIADADSAAAAQDYEAALEHMKTLEGVLAELETLLAARDTYEAKRSELEPQRPTTGQATAGRLDDMQTEIERLFSDAEAAAGSSDFETGLQHLLDVEALLPDYEELLHQQAQFDERWADLKLRIPEASEPDASPEVVELNDSILQTRTSLESKAAEGDYEGALGDADELVRLLSDLEAAKEEALRLRAEFEQEYAALKDVVEIAVSTQTDIVAVKEKQDELIARKADIDAAIAANDFDTAQDRLEDLDTGLKAYEEELRKEPRNCDWINATATALLAGIMRHYMKAQSKIDAAASAYDAALKAHKDAIDAVDSKKQLVADLVAGIFFAGLGGAAGGAVGGALKTSVEKAFVKAAASGAVLDATKDVAKFTTRFIQQLGGSPGDPTAVSGGLGGSGVELARAVGQAVNDQGDALLIEVEKLVNLVRDKPEACENGEDLRVEGDPAAALGADPFLKVLGICAKVDQRTFARLLWAEWIERHAYTIEEQCDLVDPGFSSRRECHDYVESQVDGLFAWWGDLTKNIEAQTGQDFGLRQRLDAAEERMWKLVGEQREAAH